MNDTDSDAAQCPKATIKDICDAAKNDPKLDPAAMSEERKKELIDNLLKHRSMQSHGVQVSNLAAAQDIAHTICGVEENVHSSF